ncbi:hypothetical protein [Brunnivagina elsteri]|uniref:Uncharacterized protein n=1 Tax=Brunnivagina elsteri CCALA 953 TaxID=987040 RepID=A0A2A2TNE4_9CYAN|nr:hypothetical protein [Calothrix elsteri]PAX59874.1 hypothetical protein CK510_04810 [Calothrix elsteri CCALA 953]
MSYQQDLSDRDLKNLFLRHQDSYSVCELDSEIYLISSLISCLLKNGDLTGNFNRQELVALVEVKRRLVETQARIKNGAFQQLATTRKLELQERIADAMSHEELQRVLSEVGLIKPRP